MKNHLLLSLSLLLFSTLSFSQTLSPVSLEQLVNTDIDADQTRTALAADENDGYFIVWLANNGIGRIVGRFYNSNHTAVTGEISIVSGSSASDINVEYWKDGQYIVSYIESGTAKFKIVENTGDVGAQVSIASNVDQYDVDIKGDSIACLYSFDENQSQLYLRGYNLSSNSWIGNQVLVTEDSQSAYSQPNIVYHPDGRLTAIYHYYINTSGCCDYDRRIYRKTFNSSFIAEIPEQSVWTADSEDNVGSDLHAEGNNNSEVIITTTHGTTFSQRFMRLWILGSNGSFIVNNEVLISGGGNDWYYNTEGQLYDNGNYVIVKGIRTGGFTNPNENEAYVIYGENYSASNSGPLQMNSTAAGRQEACSVAKLSTGGFVAAWAGNGFQGDDQGVYSRAYNAVAFPGIQVTGNNEVNETGTTSILAISLSTQPVSDVVISIISSNTNEVTVNLSQITFTASNWSTPVNIVATGIDDVLDDGNINVNVLFSVSESTDPIYSNISDLNFSMVNLDDDAQLTLPSNQTFCKTLGLSGINAIVSNEGFPISSVSASSSNQNVIDDADITITNSGNGTYSISIGNLNNNQTGTATITITANDGEFDYSDSFNVTTTGINLTVLASDTSICSGTEVTLFALGAQSISWDNGVENNVAFVPESTTIYTATGDDGSGCSASSSIEIIVEESPATPVITEFAGNLVSSEINNNQWYLNNTLIEGATNQLYTPTQNGEYTVVNGSGECAATSEPYTFEVIVTSVNSHINQVQILPNPASEFIYLVGLETGSIAEIHDLRGKLVQVETIQSDKQIIHISHLPKGLYIVSYMNNKIHEVQKISIQ